MSQVDFTNCAVNFSHNFGLRETYLGAIRDCNGRYFKPVVDSEMKTIRFNSRMQKFIKRGWVNIDELDEVGIKKYKRKTKLENILFDENRLLYYLPTPKLREIKIKSSASYDENDFFC
jgi:hypothetical protein